MKIQIDNKVLLIMRDANTGSKFDDPRVVSIVDELPLWSAPFGLTLLETVIMKKNMNVLDIGCGLGFPLVELAGRLGDTCNLFGIDPWKVGMQRIREKIDVMGISNIELIEGVAESLPFENDFFNLIVSNNGINNVQDPQKVLNECCRVARPESQMVITVNLDETMKEFYEVYEQTLRELGKIEKIEKMKEHIFLLRKPLELTKKWITDAGFQIKEVKEDHFSMRFVDGSALMNHFMIQIAFLAGWKSFMSQDEIPIIFNRLEENLNRYAFKNGELKLTIPFVCIDCRKKN